MLKASALDREEVHALKVLCQLVGRWPGEYYACADCSPKQKLRLQSQYGRTWRRRANEERRDLGCVGKASKAYRLFDDTRFWRCPRAYWEEPVAEYLRAYFFFDQAGTLPYAGGLMDQPARAVDAFEVIRGAFSRIDELRQEKAEREAKHRPAGRIGG